MRFIKFMIGLFILLIASPPAQAENMSGEAMKALLVDGLTLTLGGAGEGYAGSVRLEPDGRGVGGAITDSGKKLDITGTWTIQGDQFCRKWKFNRLKEVCETWKKVGDKKVEVIVDGKKVGVNSW